MRVKSTLLVLACSAWLVWPTEFFAQGAATPPRVVVTTSVGRFVIELDPVRAPLTVEAFLHYVDTDHYTRTLVHRVAAGFIIQGGGYTPTFELKPTDKTVFNESGNGLTNLRGKVGLARGDDPHSGTAQFYVNLVDNADLNPRPTRWGYAVFGTVVEGMEVVAQIGDAPTDAGGPFDRNVPVQPIVIESIERLP